MVLELRTVAIAGLGLIGGSIGLALRGRGVRVVGIDPALPPGRATAGGACDALAGSLDEALAARPDLLVLAGPVDRIEAALGAIGRVPDGVAVTDVGSVKAAICAAGARSLGGAFVGGHPLAGSERSGLDAARADLFRGAAWVLVPPASPASPALERCRALAALCGARPVEMDAARHDRIVATTSHLPHLLAAALAAHLGARAEEDAAVLDLAGRGLRDMTRIADGTGEVWRPILERNRENVRAALADALARIESAGADFGALLDAGRAARARLLSNSEEDGS